MVTNRQHLALKLPIGFSIAIDARYLSPHFASEPNILAHAINIHASFDPAAMGGKENKWLAAIKNPCNGRAEYMPVTKLYDMTYGRPGFTGPEEQTSHAISAVSDAQFARANQR